MDAISKAKQAINRAKSGFQTLSHDELFHELQVALAALNALGDCVVVPRVASDKMKAGFYLDDIKDILFFEKRYTAMIAAAQEDAK